MPEIQIVRKLEQELKNSLHFNFEFWDMSPANQNANRAALSPKFIVYSASEFQAASSRVKRDSIKFGVMPASASTKRVRVFSP